MKSPLRMAGKSPKLSPDSAPSASPIMGMALAHPLAVEEDPLRIPRGMPTSKVNVVTRLEVPGAAGSLPNSNRGSVRSNLSGGSLPVKRSQEEVDEDEMADIYNIDAIPLKPITKQSKLKAAN